jgi:phage-related protein
MSKTQVIIYRQGNGKIPLLDWLDGLPKKARIKCIEKIERLAEFGHKLRRPHCDCLQSGIYELRAKSGNVNYRILYAFAGRKIALLSHGFSKERKIPKKQITKAINNLKRYNQNPQEHTYSEGV